VNSYRLDPSGVKALGASAEMSAAMVAAAEAGKAEAERRAQTFARTGEYAASFEVVPVDVQIGRDGRTASGASLRNTAPHATTVEWGTKTRPGRHILRDVMPIIKRGGL